MRTLYTLLILSLLSIYVRAQAPGDTTVIVSAKATVKLAAPKNADWVRMHDTNCISFNYAAPYIVVLTSKCNEPQKITLKWVMGYQQEGVPLLDVPRPK